MASQISQNVSNDRRSILTDREREILLGEGEDVSEKYHGVVVSRVRAKIEGIEKDLPALEAHDTLADELREVVCNGADDGSQ